MTDFSHIDILSLKDKCGGEDLVVRELICIARQELAAQMDALILSFQTPVPDEIRKNAHALKSGLGGLEARPAALIAHDLEKAALQKDMELARQKLELLRDEMKALSQELEKLNPLD